MISGAGSDGVKEPWYCMVWVMAPHRDQEESRAAYGVCRRRCHALALRRK